MNKTLAAVITGITVPTSLAWAGNVDPVLEEATVEQTQPLTYSEPAPIGGDWTGLYLGAQLGYGDVNSSGAIDLDGNDVLGGIHAGYLYDLGSYVVGAELDYDTASIELGSGTGELDSVIRAKLKAGYDGGNMLYYGVLGAAQADATVGGAALDESGYLIGAGVDYKLTEQWVLGGEVIYHDFGDFDNSGIEIDATTVQARLSYKF